MYHKKHISVSECYSSFAKRKKILEKLPEYFFSIYGDEALIERKCFDWFARLRSEDFALNDKEWSITPLFGSDRPPKHMMNF